MPPTFDADIAAACEHLRDDGVDVVRVSYSDLIGVDRGRDVLLEELPGAAGHGLAFCRAVYHTSPVGDVVPVQGGLDAGLSTGGSRTRPSRRKTLKATATIARARRCCRCACLTRSTRCKSAMKLTEVLGDYFVTSFLSYKRNEIHRFERFVTGWKLRGYSPSTITAKPLSPVTANPSSAARSCEEAGSSAKHTQEPVL